MDANWETVYHELQAQHDVLIAEYYTLMSQLDRVRKFCSILQDVCSKCLAERKGHPQCNACNRILELTQ